MSFNVHQLSRHLQWAKALRVVYKDNLERLMRAEERQGIIWADHATKHADTSLVKHTVKATFRRVR